MSLDNAVQLSFVQLSKQLVLQATAGRAWLEVATANVLDPLQTPSHVLQQGNGRYQTPPSRCAAHDTSVAAFSKVPRKILGKLLILKATDTQVATSSR